MAKSDPASEIVMTLLYNGLSDPGSEAGPGSQDRSLTGGDPETIIFLRV